MHILGWGSSVLDQPTYKSTLKLPPRPQAREHTFVIASLTFVLVISPFLYRLLISSTFVFPEHRHAIVKFAFERCTFGLPLGLVRLPDRKIFRSRCRLNKVTSPVSIGILKCASIRS